MNIAVCVKHAVDEGELRADAAGRPVLQGAQMKMSTFDRNAVEEAVKVKEAKGGSVTVFTMGGPDAKKTLKECLAMGCDKAVLVVQSGPVDTLMTSYGLSRAIQRSGSFELVLMAEGSSDTYDGLVGPMTAQWMAIPFVGYVRRLQLGEGTFTADVSYEERAETVEGPLPCVISVVSEVNTPRYPTLLQIMQASKKPLEEINADSLRDGNAPKRSVSVAETTLQSVDRKKVIFEGSPEETSQKLLEALRKEGVA
jgi:electron transfer flavoprotein beta subunit